MDTIDIQNPVFSDPEIMSRVKDMIGHHHARLWYESGEQMMAILRSDAIRGHTKLLQAFLVSALDVLDPQHALDALLIISREYTDPAMSIALLTIDRVTRAFAGERAPIQRDILELELIRLRIEQGDVDNSLDALTKMEPKMDDQMALAVRGAFYRTWCALDKVRSDFDGFFRHGFAFISCGGDARSDQQFLHDLAVSALRGESVVSFRDLRGELLLKSQQISDLIIFLQDPRQFPDPIAEFDARFADFVAGDADLREGADLIRRKLHLAVFCDFVFDETVRKFSFEKIAEVTGVALNQVEHLVIWALCVGVIEGKIDEVEREVTVSATTPKSRAGAELKALASKARMWSSRLREEQKRLEEETRPLAG